MKTKLVILASGRGSNFQAIAKAVRSGEIPNTEILALICNNPTAGALGLAKAENIPTIVVPSPKYDPSLKKDAYENKVLEKLQALRPDYICLAGYMLLLGKKIIDAFPNKIINIHPSLLPAFKGLNAQKQAFDAKVKVSGCTVHLVNEDLDAGAVLASTECELRATDTLESFSERLLKLEHETYVSTLKQIVTGGIKL